MKEIKGLRKTIKDIPPYVPGKPIEAVAREMNMTKITKLASNENLLGPSPQAVEAIREHLEEIHRYPDYVSYDLKLALSRHLKVEPEEILLGTGADEVILLLGQLFLEPGDECIFAEPSFPVYRKAVLVTGAKPVVSPLQDYRINVEDILDRVTPRTKLVFLCNPNNPTGDLIPAEQVISFLDHLPTHVFPVIDEAYAEFVDHPDFKGGVGLFRAGRPLAAIRTFSKIYGLAGLRVGYAVLPKALNAAAYNIRNAFNVNRLGQVAAMAALEDHGHIERTRALTLAGREQLIQGLRALGLLPIPSQTNFVCVEVEKNADDLHNQMLSRGIIIRPLTTFGMPNHIRITVGEREENAEVLNALAELVGNPAKTT